MRRRAAGVAARPGLPHPAPGRAGGKGVRAEPLLPGSGAQAPPHLAVLIAAQAAVPGRSSAARTAPGRRTPTPAPGWAAGPRPPRTQSPSRRPRRRRHYSQRRPRLPQPPGPAPPSPHQPARGPPPPPSLPPVSAGEAKPRLEPEAELTAPFTANRPASPPLPPLPGGVRRAPRLTKGRRTRRAGVPRPSPAVQRGRWNRPTRSASRGRARGSAMRVEGTKQGRTPRSLAVPLGPGCDCLAEATRAVHCTGLGARG